MKAKQVKVKMTFPYLRCVKEVPSCPKIEVGDLLHSQTREIAHGYEYVTCIRREDGKPVTFRVEHLEDCFEIVEVEDEYWM